MVEPLHRKSGGSAEPGRPVSAPPPNSAGSQFYITLAPQPRLDRGYTVFGQIVAEMDVVLTIKRGDVMKTVTTVEAAP